MLRRLAKSFGTHPGEVLRWDPYDLRLAIDCEAAAARFAERRVQQAGKGGTVFPVWVIGGEG